MSFEVPDRVHLMPMGYEEQRIYESASRLKADRVVILKNDDGDEDGREHHKNAVKGLEERGYDPKTIYCNIFDLYETIGTISRLIREFEDQDVYVNISTGSKVTAIGGWIAAMIFDATPYYVKAKTYKEGRPPEGIDTITELPRYRIQAPDPSHVMVLDYLNEVEDQGVSKSKLIDFSEERELPFIAGKDISRKAKYRLIDNHLIEPLLTEGYIDISQEGRNRFVHITEEGKEMVDAFKYLLEDWENREVGRDLLNNID